MSHAQSTATQETSAAEVSRVSRVSRSFEHVQPRYFDPSLYRPGNDSPRRQVERRLATERRPVTAWHTQLSLFVSSNSFDDFRKASDERLGWKKRHSNQEAKLTSPVSDYIRKGTPIKHHAGTTEKRPGLPDKEEKPASQRQWYAPGRSSIFSFDVSLHNPVRSWAIDCERKVKAGNERRLSLKVHPSMLQTTAKPPASEEKTPAAEG